jgi:hypothetical protein
VLRTDVPYSPFGVARDRPKFGCCTLLHGGQSGEVSASTGTPRESNDQLTSMQGTTRSQARTKKEKFRSGASSVSGHRPHSKDWFSGDEDQVPPERCFA